MKKLEKIKLNLFSQDELDQRRMNSLKGGCNCKYICAYYCDCGSENPFAAADSATTPRLDSYVSTY